MNVMGINAKRDLVTSSTRLTGGEGPQRSVRMMISSAGRRVSLLRCFRESAQALGIELAICACDLQPEWSAACVEADKAFTAPPAESDAFIPAMLQICKQEGIGLVVPTIDTELIAYAQAREQFAAIGTHIAVSDLPLVSMARDKLATALFLADAGIASPRTQAAADFLIDKGGLTFPLLAKPRHGSSSRGIAVVENEGEVAALEAKEPYVLQEILEGPEFTVSIYFDSEGVLKSAVPHERLRVRGGEVEKGVTVHNPVLVDMARRLASALHGAKGALCFQTRMDAAGFPSMFEINARFGGGYPIAHKAGATFTLWTLEDWLDLPRSATDEWRAGVRMLRFDDAIFL